MRYQLTFFRVSIVFLGVFYGLTSSAQPVDSDNKASIFIANAKKFTLADGGDCEWDVQNEYKLTCDFIAGQSPLAEATLIDDNKIRYDLTVYNQLQDVCGSDNPNTFSCEKQPDVACNVELIKGQECNKGASCLCPNSVVKIGPSS